MNACNGLKQCIIAGYMNEKRHTTKPYLATMLESAMARGSQRVTLTTKPGLEALHGYP
jgi:hypothetical protein